MNTSHGTMLFDQIFVHEAMVITIDDVCLWFGFVSDVCFIAHIVSKIRRTHRIKHSAMQHLGI